MTDTLLALCLTCLFWSLVEGARSRACLQRVECILLDLAPWDDEEEPDSLPIEVLPVGASRFRPLRRLWSRLRALTCRLRRRHRIGEDWSYGMDGLVARRCGACGEVVDRVPLDDFAERDQVLDAVDVAREMLDRLNAGEDVDG